MYDKMIEILEQFGFVIRIDEELPKGRVYVKSENDRYTNVSYAQYSYLTFNHSDPPQKYIEVHTNYKQLCYTKEFDQIEKEFSDNINSIIKVDRNYNNGEAYCINFKAFDIEIFQKYLHRIFPKESREIKLKRINADY